MENTTNTITEAYVGVGGTRDVGVSISAALTSTPEMMFRTENPSVFRFLQAGGPVDQVTLTSGGILTITGLVAGVANISAWGPDATGYHSVPCGILRVPIIKVDLVTTDITGLHGIGSTAAGSVPRVPLSQEPDGIACDGSDGVDDGARLLVRALIPDFLDASTVASLSADWGYINGSGSFATLPSSPKREGEYISLNTDPAVGPNDETALTAMGVALPGQPYEIGSGRQVLAARIYKPPVEFDLATPNNTDKERNLKLAADVKLSGSDLCKPEKDIALVRPPLVLVHGVNSNPEMWGETSSTDADQFTVQFDTGSANWGFQCIDFRVAHNVPDPYLASEGEGNTLGFGEISHMYERVRDMVGGQSSSATDRFRAGSYFSSKRIAVQKVDIVAHSYGGLLSRWYTERAGTTAGSEFADRKDVRKLITLCSPHRGSPLANMVCEVFANPLIRDASSEGIGSFELSMDNLLNTIDAPGYGTALTGLGGLQGKLPNSLHPLPNRTAPRHAYQIFSVNSQRLAELNANPFHDDIGYAAVVGTDEYLAPLLRPFKALQPNWDPLTGASKPYFPWIWEFNDGATDSIVPTWSAPLGVASHNANINVDHVSVGKNAAVNAQVRTWLNNALPRGAAQRAAFDGNPPVSERNAYVGSSVGAGGISSGAGLTPDAIVKVELSAATPFDATYTSDPSDVGIKPAILTGMIQVNRIGTPTFTVVADEITDEDLHELGALAAGSLGIAAGQMTGAGANDFVAYRITSGTIGRKHKNILTGPDGTSGEDDDHLVGYAMADIPGGQSPPTEAATPDFVLPAPTKGGAGNLLITVNGSVQTTDAGNPTQTSEVQLWDQDGGIDPDDKLVEWNMTVNHPAGVWNGLLIPYSSFTTLYLDGGGNVRGADGTSDENPAQVYQKLIEPGITPNVDSSTITVP